MTITKRDIERALENFDPDARDWFLQMSREEQLAAVLSIEGSNSNRLAKVEKWQIDYERDAKLYRAQRERRENSNDEDVMSTTQKIVKALADAEAKKFNWGIYFRDRVLPNILSPAILVLLYLIFTQIRP